MKEEIQKAIQDVVAKELPKAVGDELRTRLDDLDALELLNKNQVTVIEKKDEELLVWIKEIATLQRKLTLAGNLDERAKKVAIREKDCERTEVAAEVVALKMCIEEKNTRHQEFMSLMQVAFRNTTITRVINETSSVPVARPTDAYVTQEDKQSSVTETETTE